MVAYLKKPEGSDEFHQIVDFLNASHIKYALTENPTIYVSHIKQFWQTTTAKTLDNEEIKLTATIDGNVNIVTEASGDNQTESYGSSAPDLLLRSSADESFTGVDVRYGGATTTVTGLEAGQGSVESLETDLKQTKQIYGATYTRLIKNMKKLEKTAKKIAVIDQDPGISLVQHDAEIQGRYRHDMEFDFDFDTVEKDVSTAEPISIAGAAVTTASVGVNTASPTRNTGVSTADDITMAETLVYIRKSAAKDKGKGKMVESKTIQTKTKLQQEQERLGFEAAVRLQAELEEEERQRIARVHEADSSFNVEDWEDIQARVEADEELVQRLQAEEREKYTKAEQARMLAELINQRKRYFAAQRAKERRNKPPTQAQQRTYMSNYIKNIGGYTLQQLRGYSFDEIKTLFETTMRRVNTFVPIESEVDRAVPELAAGSSNRAAEEELDQESSKRQKTGESSD
ncbi:hypothetical protein Tco_0231958 [Tanacetum coccineum]